MSDTFAAPKCVALYGSRHQEGHIADIWQVVQSFLSSGVAVYVERRLADVFSEAGYRLAVHGVKACTRFPSEADAAVSVGGDGTFLRTARWLAGREVPIVGINTGHLGFLAENSTDNPLSITRLLMSGQAVVERRLMLRVECSALKESDWPYALNEVALLKGEASMIDINVNVDGYYLASYKADGLLAATPTGSTAYNLSVGGPILAPTLGNIILSPIAPHTLTLRPVVISGDSEIEAEVGSRAADFRLSLDGRSATVPCGTIVRIRKADHSVLTLRRPNENFSATLRSKLLWGHGN